MNSKLRENLLPVVLGILGVVFLLVGAFQFLSGKNDDKLTFEPAKSEAEVKKEIMVDVEGAVIKPGVYSLSQDSRMVEVLAKAGGLSEDADREWVEKNINLASKLTDGMKIYIYRTGEAIASGVETSKSLAPGIPGLINVNSASLAELDTLPGVGPVTSQKIVDNRPYGNISDLVTKKIITSKVFEEIKDRIAAY